MTVVSEPGKGLRVDLNQSSLSTLPGRRTVRHMQCSKFAPLSAAILTIMREPCAHSSTRRVPPNRNAVKKTAWVNSPNSFAGVKS